MLDLEDEESECPMHCEAVWSCKALVSTAILGFRIGISAILVAFPLSGAQAKLKGTSYLCTQCTGIYVIVVGATKGATITLTDPNGVVVASRVAGGGREEFNLGIDYYGVKLNLASSNAADPLITLPMGRDPAKGPTTKGLFVVSPVSTALFNGIPLSLTGNFRTVDTAVNFDRTSSGFGDITVKLLASRFQVDGTGGGSSVALRLLNDAEFKINVANLWENTVPSEFDFVPFSGGISGKVFVDGEPNGSDFSGTLSGSVKFSNFVNTKYEVADFNFSLMSAVGPISGRLLADGYSICPEPETYAMMIIGFGAIGSSIRRRSTPIRSESRT